MVALALAGGYRPDEATRLLQTLDADLARLEKAWLDPGGAPGAAFGP